MSMWEIDQKYPTKLDKSSLSNDEWVKLRTLELYDYLPQTTLEERYQYTDIRDAIIELNFKFFGFIASHTFINNSSISYEDKFQSALLHFCEMWHKYRFAPKYRTDLSFGVFFKPRVGECIERELNEVKYSLRRALCMKVGDQLGKHWGKVTYDDLKLVNLPAEDMDSLKAIFGSMYIADLETHAIFIGTNDVGVDEISTRDDYDSITDLLVNEMIEREKKLSDNDLLNLSIMLDIPFDKLKDILPEAEKELRRQIEYKINMRETFGC